MSERREKLRRLLTVRRLSEDLNRRSLQLAFAAVAEVETAMACQGAALAEASAAERNALALGDRGEWLLANAQREVAGWNRGRLRVLLQLRVAEVAPAMERFLTSRREHEQVKQLVDNARQAASREADRRAQAEADDWFLSKRTRLADRTPRANKPI
jgi:alpha/beta superfamily hydrolase